MSNHEKTQKLQTIKKQPWDLQIKRNIKKKRTIWTSSNITLKKKKTGHSTISPMIGIFVPQRAPCVEAMRAPRPMSTAVRFREAGLCPWRFCGEFVVKHDETWWFLAINMMNNCRI